MVGEYQDFTISNSYTFNFVLYASFLLATTLWCTLLIIYRIVTVSRAGGEAVGGGFRAYHRLIEVLVESSALYLICLILYVGFYASNSWMGPYFDILAGSARVRSCSLPKLRSHGFTIGNCSDAPGRARCSRSCPPRRLLAGKREFGFTSFLFRDAR